MTRAVWNGVVVAETEKPESADGYVYFPRDSVRWELLQPSGHTSRCFWKGKARYYSLVVNGQRNDDAAWEYPDPNRLASRLKGHIGFWQGVEMESD